MCIHETSRYGRVLGMLLVVIAGCAPSNRAAVEGRVTLDGKPVEDGNDQFYSQRRIPACGMEQDQSRKLLDPCPQGPSPGNESGGDLLAAEDGQKAACPAAGPGGGRDRGSNSRALQ